MPPSIPGVRLWRTCASGSARRGGRIQVGEAVHAIEVEHGTACVAVEMAAATRTHRIRTDAIVLATGGIAGGGLVATGDGRLVETLLDLHVEAPPTSTTGSWPTRSTRPGHPLEAAGIRTDAALRPLDPATQRAALPNVLVAGALLFGQRYLAERCGDGVAIASGWRAATRARRRDHPRPRSAASRGATRTDQ